jgi:DNA-binding MarR family transcriptional regulator
MSGRSGRAHGPGQRSVEGLRWLERLDVAGVEPLGLALGFSRSVTYSHVQRLADAGLIVRAFDREGSVVAITAAGRRAIGAERADVRRGATHGSGLRHARAVSWVAALATLRGRVWVSDREARNRAEWLIPVVWAQHRGVHRPDLGIEFAGGRVAIEVELSYKSPRRLRAILAGHEAAIASGRIGGGLIYVSDRPDVLATVARAAARVGLPGERFRTRLLEDVQHEVRRLTRAQSRRGGSERSEAASRAVSGASQAIGRAGAVDVGGGAR